MIEKNKALNRLDEITEKVQPDLRNVLDDVVNATDFDPEMANEVMRWAQRSREFIGMVSSKIEKANPKTN